jgi:hypothetical protein
MFPNVRLMIVAVCASVVALSCGFGLFAAFRVNHEPLARLPPVAAPAQHAADNPAPPAVATATETFGTRFQVNRQNSNADVEDTGSIAPPSPAVPVAAVPPEVAAVTADSPAADSAPPATVAADDSSTPDTPAPGSAAVQSGVAAIAEVPVTTDADPKADVDPKAEAVTETAPAPQSDAKVAVAPPAEQSQPVEDAAKIQEPEQQPEQNLETVPNAGAKTSAPKDAVAKKASAKAAAKPAAKPAAKGPRRIVRKIVKRVQVAAKGHYVRRAHARALVQTGSPELDAVFPQPHFQSAPPDPLAAAPGNVRRSARRSRRAAVGGPFVTPGF